MRKLRGWLVWVKLLNSFCYSGPPAVVRFGLYLKGALLLSYLLSFFAYASFKESGRVFSQPQNWMRLVPDMICASEEAQRIGAQLSQVGREGEAWEALPFYGEKSLLLEDSTGKLAPIRLIIIGKADRKLWEARTSSQLRSFGAKEGEVPAAYRFFLEEAWIKQWALQPHAPLRLHGMSGKGAENIEQSWSVLLGGSLENLLGGEEPLALLCLEGAGPTQSGKVGFYLSEDLKQSWLPAHEQPLRKLCPSLQTIEERITPWVLEMRLLKLALTWISALGLVLLAIQWGYYFLSVRDFRRKEREALSLLGAEKRELLWALTAVFLFDLLMSGGGLFLFNSLKPSVKTLFKAALKGVKLFF